MLRDHHLLQLGPRQVAYQLRRSQRRTIGFVVGPQGLQVSAPRWVSQSQIDQVLHSKAEWILRKLREQALRQQQHEAARIEWGDGATLPYLGSGLCLRLNASLTRTVLQDVVNATGLTEAEETEPAGTRTLWLNLPTDTSAETLRSKVLRWLQLRARQLFSERLALYAPRLGVRVQRLRLSSARTRWGSASSDGSIRLNWRLIHFSLDVIDYVVVHELAHLREMNHSPAFWALVREVMPDYEVRRRGLKEGVVPVLD